MERETKLSITRKSAISGVERTIEVEVYPTDLKRYEEGGMIQNCFPYLTADEREFMKTGITKEEWDKAFA